MPKLENFATHIKIDGQPFPKNYLDYKITNEDFFQVYFAQQPQLILFRESFGHWTDLNDDAYSTAQDLQDDFDEFLFAGSDYFLNISRGIVPGQSTNPVVAFADNIGAVERTIGLSSGRYAFQSSAVTLELVSDNVNDTAAGTGAQRVVIIGLDNALLPILAVEELNGTTPVVVGTQFKRVNTFIVNRAGSQIKNEGRVSLTVQGSGEEQSNIEPDQGIARMGVFTVPSNADGFLWDITISTAKNKDVDVIFHTIAASGTQTMLKINVYQNISPIPFKLPFQFGAGTDVEFSAIGSNEDSDCLVVEQFQLIEK